MVQTPLSDEEVYYAADFAQRSPIWHAARRVTVSGKPRVTASSIRVTGNSKKRLLREHAGLLRAALTGTLSEYVRKETSFVNDAMQWGIDHERQALEDFECKFLPRRSDCHGTMQEYGLLVHRHNEQVAASPDGVWIERNNENFVVRIIVVEIKCPYRDRFNQIESYQDRALVVDDIKPARYRSQLLTNMSVVFAALLDGHRIDIAPDVVLEGALVLWYPSGVHVRWTPYGLLRHEIDNHVWDVAHKFLTSPPSAPQ